MSIGERPVILTFALIAINSTVHCVSTDLALPIASSAVPLCPIILQVPSDNMDNNSEKQSLTAENLVKLNQGSLNLCSAITKESVVRRMLKDL